MISYGTSIIIVRRSFYSCACCGACSCGSCGRASSTETISVPSDLDRYEVDDGATLTAPSSVAKYPLYLVVHNASAWALAGAAGSAAYEGGLNIYMTLYTEDGESLGPIGIGLFVFGYVLIGLTLFLGLIQACKGNLLYATGGGGASTAEMGTVAYQPKFGNPAY